jgi:hypothetical protein
VQPAQRIASLAPPRARGPSRSSTVRMAAVAPALRKNALSQAAKNHAACARVAMAEERIEKETDPRRLEQRRKQVEKGKLTPEYRRFRELVPEGSRMHVRLLHPTEPNPSEKMSARLWNLRVKTWRRCLHDYDPDVAELPPPYVSARWVHTVQKTADAIASQRLHECGEALERRARELSAEDATAALGPPAADSAATKTWSRRRVQKAFQLLDRLDGAKGKGIAATTPEAEPQRCLYELPPALPIRVASSAQEVSEALAPLLTAGGVVGLDTEWAPPAAAGEEAEERVVLLQLSTESHCVLIRLAALDAVPDCLAQLLADDQVVKCGVSIAHDAHLLRTQYALVVNGTVDLALLAHSCGSGDAGYKYTRAGLGLNPVIKSVLGYRLAKDVAVRCGDWSADLTAQQVYYAACDAHAAQRALLQLHRSHIATTPAPAATVLDWCHSHAVVDRAVGRAERELMRSQAEQAQAQEVGMGGVDQGGSALENVTVQLKKERTMQPNASTAADVSPPLSAVKSPDDTPGVSDSTGSSRGSTQAQAWGRGAKQLTESKAGAEKSQGKLGLSTTAVAAVNGSMPALPSSSSVSAAAGKLRPQGAWGSAEEVRRQLF